MTETMIKPRAKATAVSALKSSRLNSDIARCFLRLSLASLYMTIIHVRCCFRSGHAALFNLQSIRLGFAALQGLLERHSNEALIGNSFFFCPAAHRV